VLAVADSVLLRPLPVVDQDRVVIAWKEDHQAGFAHFPFTYQSIVALKDQLTTVSDFATIDYNGAWPLSTVEGDQGSKLPVGMVSGRFFAVLGVRPVAGRLFEAADDVMGGRRLIAIGEEYWRTRYQSDPGAIGRTLSVYGIPHEIVGVVPADFAYPKGAVAWIPMFTWQGEWLNNPDAVTQDIVARLEPGRTVEQFRAELEAVRGRTVTEQRPEFATQRAVVRSWTTEVVGDLRPPLILLGVGSLVVLIVACANVGSLLLVRCGGRFHEVAVRAALGGGRAQVLRAVMLEHLVLVVGGVVGGVVLAVLSLPVVEALLPVDLPRARHLSLGPLSLAAGSGLGLLIGLVAGVPPALALVRADFAAALRGAGRNGGGGWGTHPVRRLLVSGQLVLAVAAVASAGLLMRSLDRLRRIDLGFDPERLLFVDVTASSFDADILAARAMVDRFLDELSAVRGVETVAANFSPPFVGNAGAYAKLKAEGREVLADLPLANYEAVTPEYFAAMGIRLQRGRPLLASDREGTLPVVVISERLGQFLWPGEDPVGRRVGLAVIPDPPWGTVVGVYADTRYNELRTPVPSFLIPYRQSSLVPGYFLVRLRPGRSTAEVVPGIRQAVRAANPAASLIAATPMRDLLGKPLGTAVATTRLTTLFGVTALALAAIGVYGVLSSFVIQRTREIGVRMALGADAKAVSGLIVGQGLALVAGGLLVGLGASVAVGRGLEAFLYEVAPADPLTLGLVAGLLVVVAAGAMAIPIRRATRINPAEAIRGDG
jgi:putative ABC transport system permease protein